MPHSALIHVMTKAVEKARAPLLRDFGEVERLQVSQKGTANFVTNADTRTEEILMAELRHARKGWGFLTEESGAHDLADCEYRFVIDPIDGTTNFIHAIPYFCVSVAAQKRVGEDAYETIAGVVADIIHDEFYIAERGVGATMNRRKLQVSQRREAMLLATSAPRQGRADFKYVEAVMKAVARSGAVIRCAGAAALDLAYVASGRYDGLWYHRLQPWDIAAGSLLIEEAGGRVGLLHREKEPLPGSIVASNAMLFDSLNSLIAEAEVPD